MHKAIIIEDELKAQRILEHLLNENFPDIVVAAKVDNVLDGIKAVQEHNPDLVFLDIEMPVYSGLKFLEFFKNPEFEIIFTTAYSNYTLQAFELCAIGYLLKPIQIDLFIRTVGKALEIRKGKNSGERFKLAFDNIKDQKITRIALPDAEGYTFINLQDIVMLKADGSYTHIYLVSNEKILVSKTLKDFTKLLDSNPDFFRSHRSYMINCQHIKQYIKSEGGKILLHNNLEAELAREKKDSFNQFLASFRV